QEPFLLNAMRAYPARRLHSVKLYRIVKSQHRPQNAARNVVRFFLVPIAQQTNGGYRIIERPDSPAVVGDRIVVISMLGERAQSPGREHVVHHQALANAFGLGFLQATAPEEMAGV